MDYLTEAKAQKTSYDMRIFLAANMPRGLRTAERERWEIAWEFFSAVAHEEAIRRGVKKLEAKGPRSAGWERTLCTSIGNGPRDAIGHDGHYGGFFVRECGGPKVYLNGSGIRFAAKLLLANSQGIYAYKCVRVANETMTPTAKAAIEWLDAH